MDELTTREGIERRTIVKGAAWSVPIVAAAVATPASNASAPDCPTCLRPAVFLGGVWSAPAIPVLGNQGAIPFGNLFGINAVDCGIDIFQPAFTYVITQATLTMSNGNTYNSSLGLGAGSGVLGTLGAFPGTFLFTNVFFPNGGSIGLYNPHPQSLSVQVNVTLQWGLGVSLLCPVTLTWNLAGVGAGIVAFGAGAISFSGVATAA